MPEMLTAQPFAGLTNEAVIFILFSYLMLRSAGYRWRTFPQTRTLPLFRRDSRKRFDRDLLVTTLHAHNHLILVADWHFQLHRFVLFHDSAGGADAGIQEALEPLISIGGKVKSAIVGRDCERGTAGQAGRAAVLVRRCCGRRSMQHETCGVDYFADHSHGIGRSGVGRSCGASSVGQRPKAAVEDSVD